MFDVKPHVDATHDQLVHMVTELIFQNEYLKSQSEGLQVFHSESDGLSLFRSKVSPGKILERQQWHVLLGITYTLIKLSLAIMRTKERKIVFSELLSWHKEVIQGFQGPQNIRMAETSLGFTNTSLSPRPTCAWPCMATLVCNILKRT